MGIPPRTGPWSSWPRLRALRRFKKTPRSFFPRSVGLFFPSSHLCMDLNHRAGLKSRLFCTVISNSGWVNSWSHPSLWMACRWRSSWGQALHCWMCLLAPGRSPLVTHSQLRAATCWPILGFHVVAICWQRALVVYLLRRGWYDSFRDHEDHAAGTHVFFSRKRLTLS